ncbi:MAG: hypothetical protein ACRDJC_00325 [Thermomicrobiales bacterium]
MEDRCIDQRPAPRPPHGETRREVLAAVAAAILVASGAPSRDTLAVRNRRIRNRRRNRNTNRSRGKSIEIPGEPGEDGENGDP